MSVWIRRTSGQVDRWDAVAGDTRWVDYSPHRDGDELVVYAHTFRRIRERLDATGDVLMWKPASTATAHRYGAGEWSRVLRVEQSWPPYEIERVPRRRRRPRPE